MHSQLHQYISRYVLLTEEESQIVADCLKWKTFAKKKSAAPSGGYLSF